MPHIVYVMPNAENPNVCRVGETSKTIGVRAGIVARDHGARWIGRPEFTRVCGSRLQARAVEALADAILNGKLDKKYVKRNGRKARRYLCPANDAWKVVSFAHDTILSAMKSDKF